ncbi:MAG: NADH-quinone oxidoreductase subunit N [Acidobacteria bacterium]|nr:NADH-quinone oxidoreductase subunit N [Acidobacteriota bacterium]
MQSLNLNYYYVLPHIILSITGIMSLLFGAFNKQAHRDLVFINSAGLITAGVSTYRLWNLVSSNAKDGPLTAFSGMVVLDHMSLAFIFIFLIVAFLSTLLSLNFLEDEDQSPEEFNSLLLFATVGMMLMASAGDMVMVFLGLEIASIATYVLAGYRKTDLRSNESALKYFILGSFSTAFLLYGMALVYGATGSTNLETISNAIKSGNNAITAQPMVMELLYVGAGMLLVGFGFKISTAPFHVWTPDVYQGAPTSVTAFMATGPKAAAFVAFLRIFVFTFAASYSFQLHTTWVNLLQVLAILTMIIGNIVALSQTDIKRVLAYSSIAHAGYALIGFLADDWISVAFYMLTYSIMNIGAFAVVSVMAGKGDEKTELENWAGMGFKSLGLSIALLVFMLSMAGMPLTGGFMGKFFIFKTAWDKGFHIIVIVAVLNSAISVYYYLRPMVMLFFRDENETNPTPLMSWTTYVTILLALAGTFYLGIMPGRLFSLLEVAKDVLVK